MREVFNDKEFIKHGEEIIDAQWKRCELTRKPNNKVFKDNDKETFQKDYVHFDYKGIHIEYSCEVDDHTICDKVNNICDIIDAEGTKGLTANNIKWRII